MEPDPNPGPDPGHEHFFKIYWIFFYKAKLSNYLSSFFRLTFMLKLDEPFTVQEIFSSTFLEQFIFGFLLQILVDILPLKIRIQENIDMFAVPDTDLKRSKTRAINGGGVSLT